MRIFETTLTTRSHMSLNFSGLAWYWVAVRGATACFRDGRMLPLVGAGFLERFLRCVDITSLIQRRANINNSFVLLFLDHIEPVVLA